MKDSGKLANVKLDAGFELTPPGLSTGCFSLGGVRSRADPQNGCGSPTTGRWALVVLILRPNPGCLTHCVIPDWPAIMAMAFGVEGPITVSKKLSKSVKGSAYCQRNGTVLQSTWLTTSSPFCTCASVGAGPV